MTTEKILSVVAKYKDRLTQAKIPKKRIDPQQTFKSLSESEILAHAHYLCDNIKEYAKNPNKVGKTGRHLASIQMCLSFAGWLTLEEMMNDNRPDYY